MLLSVPGQGTVPRDKKEPTPVSIAPGCRSPTSGDVPCGFQLSSFLRWGKGVLTPSYMQRQRV